jgi:uncharacterized protein YeaO (DUF488 family)
MLRIKSIEEPATAEDGLRILATRYRGRGLPKSKYDVWMANLGPSETLLAKHKTMSWRDWSRRFRDEMLGDEGREKQNPLIRNAGQKFTLRLIKHLAERQNVTLLCHCAADAKHCHRFLLRDLINSSRV